MRRAGVIARGKAAPAAAAESIVHVDAELGEGTVGNGLDHAGKAGLCSSVESAFAGACVLEAVGSRLPGLGSVKQENANAAHGAEMIEAAGENFGIDGRLIERWIEAGGLEGNDLATG